MFECRAVVSDRRIHTLTESDEVASSTVESIIVCVELKACQNSTNLQKMIWILGADKKVQIDETRFCCHVKPNLDIRKKQLDVG